MKFSEQAVYDIIINTIIIQNVISKTLVSVIFLLKKHSFKQPHKANFSENDYKNTFDSNK